MSKSTFKFSIEPWITTQEKVEYTTKIFKVLKRAMKIESENHESEFAIVEAPDWINVIALTENNEIVLVEQYRYGIDKPTLEFPGGMVDEGEDPLETSERELLEETGFSGDEWYDLGAVSSNPAFLTNYTYTYLVRNCKRIADQKLDGNERINVQIIPFEDFLELVKNGTVHHSLVVAGLAKFMLSEQFVDLMQDLD